MYLGTKTARKLPADFAEQKSSFLTKVADIIQDNEIPENMVINWDQTGWSLSECNFMTIAL